MKKDRVIQNYVEKERFIEPKLYKELKSKKKCMRCKKKFSGRIPEIHHIVPVHPKDGRKPGSNNRDNLLSVCHKCHQILDEEAGIK